MLLQSRNLAGTWAARPPSPTLRREMTGPEQRLTRSPQLPAAWSPHVGCPGGLLSHRSPGVGADWSPPVRACMSDANNKQSRRDFAAFQRRRWLIALAGDWHGTAEVSAGVAAARRAAVQYGAARMD